MASRRLVAALCIAAVGICGVPMARAQSEDPAIELLRRVARADDAPYRARQLVVTFGDRRSAAVLDVQSTDVGRFVRAESGGDVTRLWTRSDMGIVAGPHSGIDGGVAQVRVSPDVVMAKYAVEAGPPEDHLGVELVPLTLARRSDALVAERWWVHEQTGVVYKREIFDAHGALAGMATLLEMHWGEPGPAEPVEVDLAAPRPATTTDASDAPRRLTGGYRLWRTYEVEVAGRVAEQWVYSDGLHAMSVFRTPGHFAKPAGFADADVGAEEIWRGPGPSTWAWQGGGHGYLVIAEEAALDPASTIAPFPRGGPSLWARLGSVWSRAFRALGGLFDRG